MLRGLGREEVEAILREVAADGRRYLVVLQNVMEQMTAAGHLG